MDAVPEFGGMHPFCFGLNAAVVIVIYVFYNCFREVMVGMSIAPDATEGFDTPL